MSRSKYFVVFVVIVLVAFVLNGCLMSQSPTSTTEPKTVLKGRVMVPEGTVKGKQINGQALVGATVNIIDPKTGNVIANTTTDTDGNYSVEVPAGGPYIVEAVKENVKVLDVSPVIQAGETKNLGTADATSTAQALIFQALVNKGNDPAQINIEGILNLTGFSQLVKQVESALEAGTDPTTNSQVNSLVNNIISPKPPTGGGGGGAPTPTPTPNITITAGQETVSGNTVTLPVTTTNTGVAYTNARYGIKVNLSGITGDTITLDYGTGTFDLTRQSGTDDFLGYFGPQGGFTIESGWNVTTTFTADVGSSSSQRTQRTATVDVWVGQAPTPAQGEAVASMQQKSIVIPVPSPTPTP